jgi:Glycosyl transferase family 2
LRRLHWGIDYCESALAQHLSKSEFGSHAAPDECPTDNGAVSCLCVTHNRVDFLRRSVQCFLSQSYAEREMVVVHQSDDEPTRQFLASLGETSIRPVEVPAAQRLSLGTLRNVACDHAVGKYVATWDDDDWHGPDRLAQQVAAMHASGKRACLLARVSLHDREARRSFVSYARPWEQSMIAEKSILPRYPDVPKGEDTAVVAELIRDRHVVLLDRPELYLYTYHGLNTWDRNHWRRIVRRCRPLGLEESEAVNALLDSDAHGLAHLQSQLDAFVQTENLAEPARSAGELSPSLGWPTQILTEPAIRLPARQGQLRSVSY